MGELYLAGRLILLGIIVLLCFGIAEALEIKSGTSEDLTIFLQNATTGAPIQGAVCILDVWLPNSTKILDDGAMTELGEGFYIFSTYINWTASGNYRVLAKCSVGSENYYSAMMFSIVATTVTEWFETINQTTTNTYNYLQNTIYPAVDTVEDQLNDILANQTNLWNKLVAIQDNVTANYNEIINTQSQLGDVNSTIISELNEHKNRLISINNTVNAILDNITQTITPKLNQLQNDINLIKGYTDTLEANQSSIASKLDAITSYVDTVELGINNLQSDLNILNSTIDAGFDTIDSSLSSISTIVQEILSGQDSINAAQTLMLNQILSIVASSNTTINWIESYLNGTISTDLQTLKEQNIQIINLTEQINMTTQETLELAEEINTTTKATYDLLVSLTAAINSIYADTQSILTKWGSLTTQDIMNKLNVMEARLDNTTANDMEILNAVSDLASLVNITRNEIGFSGQSLTAYEYFINLESELISINTTLFNKIEFEANKTTQQVLSEIQSNTNAIVNEINANEGKLDDILTRWGDYTAADISDAVTANRNKLFELENWLNAFNNTEEKRHNETGGWIDDILAWFSIIDQSEEERHNQTKALVSALSGEINTTKTLSNQIITMLGYGIKNSTVYDDLVILFNQNNQIISLAHEINLTAHQAYGLLLNVNEAVGLISSDTQDILAKWGAYNAALISDKLNVMDAQLDIIQDSGNNTAVLNAVSDLEAIINITRNELGFNGQSLTVYGYLVSLESELISINTTLFNKIEFEANKTTQQVLSEIQSNTNAIVNEINANEGKLDNILVKWGSYSAADIINEIAINRNKLIQLENWLNAFNDTEAQRHIENQGWFNTFDAEEAQRHNQTQTQINNLFSEVNSTKELSNQIITMLGYSGKNNTVFDNIADLSVQLEKIIVLAAEINLTAHNIEDKINAQILPKLNDILADTSNLLAKWGNHSADSLVIESQLIKTKLNNIQTWLDSFNSTQQQKYADIITEVNDTGELLTAVRAELGLNGQSLTAYEYFVKLDNIVLSMNSSIIAHVTSENTATIAQLTGLFTNKTSNILAEINENEAKLDSILNKWSSYDAEDILQDITENRNRLISLESWLEEYNTTALERTNVLQSYLSNVVLAEIDEAEELANDIISYLGYAGTGLTLKNDVELLKTKEDYITVLVEQINLTANKIKDTVAVINTTLNLAHDTTQLILDKWDNWTVQDIVVRLNEISSTMGDLAVENNNYYFQNSNVSFFVNDSTPIHDTLYNIESILSSTRSELGFEGQSLTAYEYIVSLESEIISLESTMDLEFALQNQTLESIRQIVISNTSSIIGEINDNENQLLALVTNWSNNTAEEIISDITAVRNDIIGLNSLINALDNSEIQRHNTTWSLLNDLLAWLHIRNQTEAQRFSELQSQITDVLSDTDEITSLSNSIIAQLGFSGVNMTVYDQVLGIMNLMASLVETTGSISNVNYINLSEGINAFALPKQPSNNSIEFVTANITGKFSRIDHYSAESDQWQVYNPDAPFGNTLHILETQKVYWIYAAENTVWYIK